MLEKTVTIINKLGLHARASAKLVECASRYQCTVNLIKENKIVNGKSIMGVMMLAANQNSTLTIQIEGPDEIEAMERLVELINNRFDEEM